MLVSGLIRVKERTIGADPCIVLVDPRHGPTARSARHRVKYREVIAENLKKAGWS
jgi:hypothetical protein